MTGTVIFDIKFCDEVKLIIMFYIYRSLDGDVKIFEEIFNFCSPKFVSPTPPAIVPPFINTHLEPTVRQWKVLEDELEIQSKIPGTRRYLKLYTTMPLSKLAGFLDVTGLFNRVKTLSST